ncbi:VWA domain-containing protein [Methylobacterium sp. BTF04]|uniref:vWA domain-containing protein n=1 Tax=Methylobacterium sp. BTF04 TaxID=2708300 RepID=UPI0013D4D430|nr:VWA domain-containing protein [Methylobacterium sp. BTF04]NEU11770.1 VWA domain-containing protein [Methylobacterium sp. BTF04]
MLLQFFTALRQAKLPVTLREFLTLLDALDRDLAEKRVEEFYLLARTALVKDERNLDRFDRVFGAVFNGFETVGEAAEPTAIPEEWLRKLAEKYLTDAEKAELQALGWDALFETLKQRLAEQKERHQGGSKWIGTGGTSPFGAYGYNPEGIRIGQDGNRNFRAVKVWDKRTFKDLDDTVALGTRNMRVALRRLRRFARAGAADELDLDGTIRETAAKGYLDVKLRPERRNAVKVLLFLDVGGSMDWHIALAEELFSAARSEFKHFEHFYFHNCPYERVWKDNRRRHDETLSLLDVIRTYPPDYRVVFVGDASMSPYEIAMAGGSVEHWNEEPGQVWLGRLLERFPKAVWLNPVPAEHWSYTQSIGMIRQIVGGRMFPLNLEGIDGAMRALVR